MFHWLHNKQHITVAAFKDSAICLCRSSKVGCSGNYFKCIKINQMFRFCPCSKARMDQSFHIRNIVHKIVDVVYKPFSNIGFQVKGSLL